MSAIRSEQAPRTIWGQYAKPQRATQQVAKKSSNTMLWIISLSSLTLNIFIVGGILFARGLVGGMVANTNQALFTSLETLENLALRRRLTFCLLNLAPFLFNFVALAAFTTARYSECNSNTYTCE